MITVYVTIALGIFITVLADSSFAQHSASLLGKLRAPHSLAGACPSVLPVALICVAAALNGKPEIAPCVALGSVVSNSCLTGGIASLFFPAEGLLRKNVCRELLFFLMAAVFIAFSASETAALGVGLGIILLSMLMIYLLTSRPREQLPSKETNERLELIVVGLGVSAAALYIGPTLLLDNAIAAAQGFGVSEKAIALTLIGAGASLPNLAATLAAGARKHRQSLIGNIMRANDLNLLFALGLSAVAVPVKAGREIYRDIAFAALAMLLFALPPLFNGKTYRLQGALLLGVYVGYCLLNFI